MQCPRCQHHMAYDKTIGKLRCPDCGFRLFEDDLGGLPASQAADSIVMTPRPPQPGLLKIDLTAGMDFGLIPEDNDYELIRIKSACFEAIDAIHKGNYPAARVSLNRLTDLAPTYSEAWLYLAAIAETPQEQRDYLEHAVACGPTNMRATQYLLQLKNRETPQPDGALPRLEGMITSTRRLGASEVAGGLLICPQCGGRLDYNIGEKEVACKFCGYHIVEADKLVRTKDPTPIAAEILKRKQTSSEWNIGGRWLRCPGCGASTTVTRASLTSTCRFCGSQQVIQESARNHFEQPDLIIALGVSEADARASIERKLHSGLRALTSMFADKIAQTELHGVYLPFWVFDADMSVKWSWTNAPDRGENPEMVDNALYFAANMLPRPMMDEAEPFDLSQSVDYDPRLLASFPALLYDVDAVQASIDVREKLSRIASWRARDSIQTSRPVHSYNGDSKVGELNLFASASFITYRFGLLPFWVGRLVEEDGDTRQVVVNGQTGESVLGKLTKNNQSGKR